MDWWIAALVLVAPAAGFLVVATSRDWVIALVTLLVMVVIGMILWPCDYTLGKDGLLVRSGVIKWRVPYERIERVFRTRNPLSSPAWSLDRIAVVYGRKFVMVSPDGGDEFLRTLARLAGLKWRGQELVR